MRLMLWKYPIRTGSPRSATAATGAQIAELGLLIEAGSELIVGEMIEVNLPQAGLMEAKIVWVGGDIYCCRFTRQLTPTAISAARLGGRFELITPNIQPERSAVSTNAVEANNPLSLSAKMRIIVGLALCLWMTIGVAAYWIMT